MLIKLYEENTNPKQIRQIIEVLEQGGLIIYPTDTVYGIGCDLYNSKAIERLAQIGNKKASDTDFSFLFSDLSQVSEYTSPISNDIFRLLKHNLPGPFTFILGASNKVPKIFKNKKKTIGIRIPDNPILQAIIKEFSHPILNTSVHDDDEVIEYTTDPELIHEKYCTQVELVIDGGFGNNVASTIVDCTGQEPEIIRQGIGELI